jgi:transposase-like protein
VQILFWRVLISVNGLELILKRCLYFHNSTPGSFFVLKKMLNVKLKVHRSLKEKKAIVGEAYNRVGNVKVTARRHNIQPYLIHRWRASIIQREADNAVADGGGHLLTKEEIRVQLQKKTAHHGTPSSIPEEQQEQLLQFYRNLWKEGHVVNVPIMIV